MQGDFLGDSGRLLFRVPRTTNDMWVFWSQEEGEGEGGGDLIPVTETLINNNRTNVQEYLKYLLCNADAYRSTLLIQFWAPTPTTITSSTLGEGYVFKTSNQPFGLYELERGICEYRKHCTSLEFNVFLDEKIFIYYDFGSTIGRVFRDKEADSFIDFRLLDFVPRKYGHTPGSFLLPLFKPSSRCCSGVLQLIGSYVNYLTSGQMPNLTKAIFKGILSSISKVISRLLCQNFSKSALPLQEANFMYPSPLELVESTEIEEINKALQVVCTTHQLPLAQIWVPCCTSTAMAYVDSPGEGCHSPYLSCSSKFSSSISQNGDAYIHYKEIEEFNLSCNSLRKGQSIVGKALLYHKPCFCRDVTQLPKAEYPLSNAARNYGLTGCCAIWLHSTRTKNHDYVLEFFPPPWNTISGDYLELLLTTVKKQLPGFKISSVGEESCVEVCEISVNDDKPDSVIISQTFSVKPVPESFVNEKEMVQNEVVGETVIDSGSNILGLEQNGIDVCHSTAGEELFVEAATTDEIAIRLPPMFESLRNENEVVLQLSDDEPTMEEAVRKNELNVGIIKKTNVAVTSSERIFSRAEASEREYRTTDITLRYEDLRKHFGKKLDDAAKILEVSRSTMKRACRRHNIKKWPAPKRKKVNVLRVCSGNEGIEGTYKGDPSCSDPPPTPGTAGISHKTSNSRQEQDVGTVTVKATHGGHTIRFGLPFLSRKTDLVKQVIKRLPLNEGSFNIKYQDEDNDWILIACDEDLDHCIGIWKGNRKIKMLVQPITNQAP
ncbi:hypothetical protein LguiA_029274 [Lonicera macranthoides]